MANVTVDSIVQWTVTGSCFRQIIRHVRQWRVKTVGSLLIAERAFQEAMLAQFKDGGVHDLITPYLACLASNYQLYDIKCQVIKPTRTAYSIQEYLAGPTGTGTTANTGNVQSAFTASGEFTGRHYRGVYKIGPIPTAASVDGAVTGAQLVKLGVYATTFTVVQPVTVDADLVTLQPCLYQAPPKGAPAPYSSKDIVSTRLAYQTRVKNTRTVGRGE